MPQGNCNADAGAPPVSGDAPAHANPEGGGAPPPAIAAACHVNEGAAPVAAEAPACANPEGGGAQHLRLPIT